MSENFGLKIGLEGEREFKKSLAEINNSFKVLGSEMKLVDSQFDKNDKSAEALTARNRVLNKEMLIDNLPLILDVALQLVTGLAQGILDSLPVLIEALSQNISGIVNAFGGYFGQMAEVGGIVDGIKDFFDNNAFVLFVSQCFCY